jgi:hypothetical protein
MSRPSGRLILLPYPLPPVHRNSTRSRTDLDCFGLPSSPARKSHHIGYFYIFILFYLFVYV